MAMIIPDKICLCMMVEMHRLNQNKATFKISELERLAWRAVERRNKLEGKRDFIAIKNEFEDDDIFERFSARLEKFCDVNQKEVVLKTDTISLKNADAAVKELDEVTKTCCTDVVNKLIDNENRKIAK